MSFVTCNIIAQKAFGVEHLALEHVAAEANDAARPDGIAEAKPCSSLLASQVTSRAKAGEPKWPPSILDIHSKRQLGLSIGDDPLFMIMLGLFHFNMIGCAEELEEDCNSDMIEKC